MPHQDKLATMGKVLEGAGASPDDGADVEDGVECKICGWTIDPETGEPIEAPAGADAPAAAGPTPGMEAAGGLPPLPGL